MAFIPPTTRARRKFCAVCGRALIFGDKNTTAAYANNPAIQIHGPGYSKILIGEDEIERWPEFIDLMVAAISDNGGRSCINASAVVVPKYAAEIADALARKLGPIVRLPATDENARLSGFANAKMADFIDAAIEEGLKTPRRDRRDGQISQRPAQDAIRRRRLICGPTIVLCDSFAHPLANREFLCPYASVVERAAGGNAGADRAVAGGHRHHAGTKFSSKHCWNRR